MEALSFEIYGWPLKRRDKTRNFGEHNISRMTQLATARKDSSLENESFLSV